MAVPDPREHAATMRPRLLFAALMTFAGIAGVPMAVADPVPMCDTPPCSRSELERYERKVVHRLLRAQQLRFEAEARGDAKALRLYDRQFQRTRDHRQMVREAIEGPS